MANKSLRYRRKESWAQSYERDRENANYRSAPPSMQLTAQDVAVRVKLLTILL